jgi:hypothetical protein
MIVLGPKYVTWCAMAIEVKGFFNFVICWTRWLLMWRIEITYPSLQKLLLFCDYICILLLAHITPYHGELVLGMHVAKYASIIAIWFESLCWFLEDQFKELQIALNDKVRQGMHWMEDCDIFRHKASPLETQNLNKIQIYQQCSSIPWYLKEYWHTLNLCYGRQESQELQGVVPNPHRDN